MKFVTYIGLRHPFYLGLGCRHWVLACLLLPISFTLLSVGLLKLPALSSARAWVLQAVTAYQTPCHTAYICSVPMGILSLLITLVPSQLGTAALSHRPVSATRT